MAMNIIVLAIAGIGALMSSTASAEVRVERVFFVSQGERMSGTLYLPGDADLTTRPASAIVVTGAWMTVKEQMPARYAREMAERGFVALTFDFRGWGESGGARRQLEDPGAKIADIRAAVNYLGKRPEVDAGRIGSLGICASSGYMVHAAADLTLKAIALVAPWLHDRQIVEDVYGGSEGIAKLIASGDAADIAFETSGWQNFVPAASLTDHDAIMFGVPYYTEPSRGLIPAWRNAADPAFWRGWLTFDAVEAAPKLTQPLLMVHSDAAAIPQGARKFYAGVTAPKQELWLDNVTQFDFYDQDMPVKMATDAVAAHFRKTMEAR